MTAIAEIPRATSTTYQTAQIWAVWSDDFDKRVRVRVEKECSVEVAREFARVAGARVLGCEPSDCEARYIVTRTERREV